MKRLFTFVVALMATFSLLAETNFSYTSLADANQTKDGFSVVIAQGSGQASPAYNSDEFRVYASNTITISGKGITRIAITCAKQGTKEYATLTANPATLTSGGTSTDKSDPKTDVWTGTADKVVLTVGSKGQRIIKQIVVTGEGGEVIGGDPGEDQNDTLKLDPDYKYSEPTIVYAQGKAGSNQTYAFVDNNIKVSCNKGAIFLTDTLVYFGCNAGQTLTITAAKNIKAIVVDGLIKKDFTATASSGEILYAETGEADLEAETVLAVTDVDAKSLTINCAKQLRVYAMYVYFEENPEIELGGYEEEYTYDWEPTEVTTIETTFDYLEVGDMTESLGYPCSYLYFENDDHVLELDIFASLIEDQVLPAGTYTINDSYDDNTVMASPGMDALWEEDYPSYFLTDWEEDAEYGWVYNAAYYIVSGTLTVAADPKGVKMTVDARTAHGSTIKASYVGTPVWADLTALEENPTQPTINKIFRQGMLIIERNGVRYTVLGQTL